MYNIGCKTLRSVVLSLAQEENHFGGQLAISAIDAGAKQC